MKFSDAADWVAEQFADPLEFTIRGHTFTFPPPSALTVAQGVKIVAFRDQATDLIQRAQAGETVDMSGIDVAAQLAFVEDLLGERREQMREHLTQLEYERMSNAVLLTYLYGSEYGQQAWDGTLDQARDSLGETLGLTEKSSTPKAPTGSTPTSTSKPEPERGARRRGSPSAKRGRASKPTSTATTKKTSRR